jgi:endonuclease/exonuclease/phosphatase family metal-dependent hydrolase
VHHWIGTDGKRNMDRCLDVLRETGAQVAGLQEAGIPLWSLDDSTKPLAARTGMKAILGPTLEKGQAHFGNVLLSAFPVRKIRLHDISLPGKEPRGVVDADLQVGGEAVRVLVTHFGLRARERRVQARMLMDIVSRESSGTTVILGDFNEWFRLSGTLRILRGALGVQQAPRTFPSVMPLFALDRIWVMPWAKLKDVRAHSSALSRTASDHLPLTARVTLP